MSEGLAESKWVKEYCYRTLNALVVVKYKSETRDEEQFGVFKVRKEMSFFDKEGWCMNLEPINPNQDRSKSIKMENILEWVPVGDLLEIIEPNNKDEK